MSSPMTPTRVMYNTAAALAVLAIAWALVQARSIIVVLFLGIIFAAAIEPLVFRLRRAGLRRGQAILIVYACLFALLGVTIYLAVPAVVRQVSAFDAAIPDIFDRLREQALASDNTFIRRTGFQSLQNLQDAYTIFRYSPNIGQDQALGVATSVFGILLSTVSLMIIAFYWMTEKATIKRVILGLFPFRRRARVHAIWDEIEYKLGGWTRGQLAMMTIIGFCSGLFYYIIDLNFWLPLGIFAGITELIPFIGPFIGGGAAALIALAESPEKALVVIVFVFVLQQLEGAILVPRVMKNAVGMSPLTVVLAVLIGGVLMGIVGSLLAIPIGAAGQVLVGNLLRLRDDRIAAELRLEEIHPLAAVHLNSPIVSRSAEQRDAEGTRKPPSDTNVDDRSRQHEDHPASQPGVTRKPAL